MKHWDLTPGEKVILARSDTARALEVVFLWRDTIRAVFKFATSKDGFELELASDGSFRDAAGKRWFAEGTTERESKIVVEEPLGEGPRFTRALRQRVRKARA